MTEPSLPPPDNPAKRPKPEGRAAQRLLVVALALIVIGGGGLLAWDRLRDRGDVIVRPLPSSANRAAPAPAPVAPAPDSPVRPDSSNPAPPDQSSAAPSTEAPNTVAPSAVPPSTVPSPAAPPASANGDLAARIADLERRLAAPPSEPAPNSAATAQIAQLEARVATLENSVAVERSRADRAERTARSLGDRLGQAVHAASALARLRTNLERGQPFEREYDEVYAILGNDSAAVGRLQALRQWAESGIPTRSELREALESQGSEIVRAAMIEDSGNWWQSIVARLKALVVVRPTPDADIPAADAEGGDRPAAVVARAEARARDGDVAGAISEMTTLTGGAADVALAWVAAARARVGADETIDGLEEAIRKFADTTAQKAEPRPEPDVPTEAP